MATDLHVCEPGCPETHREHLDHMTDGRWHDDCRFCLCRREKSGTGLEGEATPGQIRLFLQGAPHPFAADGASTVCVCGFDLLAEVHDDISLLDARAVLNGTGGARGYLARATAARMEVPGA